MEDRLTRVGRALVLPKDFGPQPIDIEEPGPWCAAGARGIPKQLYKNKQTKGSHQNPFQSNE